MTRFTNLDFRNANLYGAAFTGVDLSNADFRNADLGTVVFADCDLNSANLSAADLSRAIFQCCVLEQWPDIDSACIEDIHFKDCTYGTTWSFSQEHANSLYEQGRYGEDRIDHELGGSANTFSSLMPF